MSKIAYITNASQYSGVGHRAHAIASIISTRYMEKVQPVDIHMDGERRTLSVADEELLELSEWPSMLNAKSIQWVRLGKRLTTWLAGEEAPSFGLYHFTNQSLSFLAKKLSPSVVTVHDLIEITDPQDKQAQLLNRYLYSGIPHADQIICVSEYTKRAVQEHYNIPDEKISVIHNGVSDVFHPIEDFRNTIGYQRLRKQLELNNEAGPIVLYVGSDHPRKNVGTAIKAFARIRETFPNAVFIKVGAAGIAAGREELLTLIDTLKLREAVRFINTPLTDVELNEYFNLADVFVFPSTHEGFGLPPLQAMAAGTPVVCSNATSLPEVVGSAALTHEPLDVAAMTDHLQRVLQDTNVASQLRAQGLERATLFSWDKAAEQELKVYMRLI